MLLKEKYGLDELEYYYLEPENVNESALSVELSRLFPKMFELLAGRNTASWRWKLKLKVVCEE